MAMKLLVTTENGYPLAEWLTELPDSDNITVRYDSAAPEFTGLLPPSIRLSLERVN